ncbi:MAG: hypothetical protein OHK0012_15050 [Synechococcales cyanobacterium]
MGYSLVTPFTATAQVIQCLAPKYLELHLESGPATVKVAKHLRPLIHDLAPQSWIRIHGQQKISLKHGEKEIQYKVSDLRLLSAAEAPLELPLTPGLPPTPPVFSGRPLPEPTAPPTRVFICTKGTCRKQGSLALLRYLEEQGDRHIQVEAVGCLKQCGSGPTVRIGKKDVLTHTTLDDLRSALGWTESAEQP